MAHFTYSDSIDKTSLHQGDLIERTANVEKILKEVHPHYFENRSNKYFLVITQTCDLVLRNGSPQSRYITIAAVRPMKLAIEREIERIQYDNIEKKLGICDKSKQFKIEQFIERLLNNNDQEYFYLHKEPNQGLDEDYCAFLRLTIPLKSNLHYKTLLEAKILQLKESFQHKLGYLVGNIYSRVGTEDWLPNNAKPNIFRKKIRDSLALAKDIIWLEKDVHRFVLKTMKELQTEDQNIEKLEEILKVKKKNDYEKQKNIVEIIANILSDLGIDENIVETAKKRILNRPDFRASLK